MAQVIADRRDVDFVLYEQLEIEKLCKNEKYSDFNKKTFDMIISEARNLAIKEILPTFSEGDRQGLVFENGTVRMPECFHRAYDLFKEGEWTALTAPPELGGQGLPAVVAQAVVDYFLGANYSLTLCAWSGFGAGELVEAFGTPKQKEIFLKKMYSGEWGGTMALTESDAGSDVGALTTTAVKNNDGTYTITGSKIFITNAEQDLTENIINPVLARIEGAPAGTRGISLFLVPKIWVNEDGSLGEPNDVVCTGIEEKMGMHGSPTCSLTFGGKGGCRGLLLGEENKGMRAMFHLINNARLIVGAIGFTNASTAYLYAANYAKQRVQGRSLENAMNPDAPSVTIVQHPDVRRMLMWMKSHVDGMRSLLYYGAHLLDLEKLAETPQEQEYYGNLLSLLTPVIKSFCTDCGFEVCSEAMQVLGGYGYTKDFPIEQHLRDVRIAAIYEGTNGIQAMDLLARKLGMQKGMVFMNYLQEIQKTVIRAKDSPATADLAGKVKKIADKLGETAMHMGKTAMSPEFKTAFVHATPFQRAMGDVTLAWMLLWRAAISAEKLTNGAKKKDAVFYQGQIQTAAFFINTILPVTAGRMDAIQAGDASALEAAEAIFGG
jgi:hypothetical protein